MTRAAILIDGGYLLKRLPALVGGKVARDPEQVSNLIGRLVARHLAMLNKTARAANHNSLLYRCFYYDARPYMKRAHLPVSKRAINYAESEEAVFRKQLFELLKRRRSFAVRLGEVHRERSWILKESAQKDLLANRRAVADLADADFAPGFRQKTVDMRIGLDIASITLKKQADTIILVTGDRDFVPVAKFARREGVQFILDPLWRNVDPGLFEHIDGLRSGLPKPEKKAQEAGQVEGAEEN